MTGLGCPDHAGPAGVIRGGGSKRKPSLSAVKCLVPKGPPFWWGSKGEQRPWRGFRAAP